MESLNSDPRVLLVDDVVKTRLYLEYNLEQCGYSDVITAGNVDEALIKLRSIPIDIIIARLNMMPQSGIDLLTIIQQDPVLKDLSVVLFLSTETEQMLPDIHLWKIYSV